jgi:hypothetical protein
VKLSLEDATLYSSETFDIGKLAVKWHSFIVMTRIEPEWTNKTMTDEYELLLLTLSRADHDGISTRGPWVR